MTTSESEFISSDGESSVFEKELFLQVCSSVDEVFTSAQQNVLEQCAKALQSVEQVHAAYVQAIAAAGEEVASVQATEDAEYSEEDSQEELLHYNKEYLLLRRQLRLLKYKSEQVAKDDIPLLYKLQELIRGEQYNEVMRLADEYREILSVNEPDMLKQFHSERCFQEVQQAIASIAEKLHTTLNDALEHINNFWFRATDTHDEAQQLLEREVLKRYPDHQRVREVQRGWARHDIKQGLEADSQDYAVPDQQIQELQEAFWGADEAEQTWAVEAAHNLDPDAQVTSPGLEQAAAAVERLSDLSPSSDLTLQQNRLEVREQRTRRQLLRLRARLYRNDLRGFDQEMRVVQEQGVLLQDVRKLGDEYAAVTKMNEALVAFENGDWQRTWAAARAARSSFPDVPRIDLLIERTQRAAQTQISLGDQIRQTLSDLLMLEHTPDMTGTVLIRINAQIQEIKEQIDQYTYFARQYTGQYTDLLERYQMGWQQAAIHAFDSRRLNMTDDPRAIEELERLVSIAPESGEMGALIHRLQGREQVLRARQMIAAACLNQAEEHVRTATNLLPADDQLFQEVRDTLRQKQAFVHFSIHQAKIYTQQHELSSALQSIQEALANNQEDQEAEAIRANLEEEIREVQELARQAADLEHADLHQALVLWEEVCRRHTDGSYPPATPPNERPFIEWQNEVKQRITMSRQRIDQARAEFQSLRDWLVEQKRPDWEAYSAYCRQVLDYLGEVDPGMRQEQLVHIQAAVHLLERYRDTYQQIERVLKPGPGQPADPDTREQTIREFQKIWADIRAFNGKEDELLEDLATSVQTSYDRMDRLIKYT